MENNQFKVVLGDMDLFRLDLLLSFDLDFIAGNFNKFY